MTAIDLKSIQEHRDRALAFLKLAADTTDARLSHWLRLSATYSAAAMADQALGRTESEVGASAKSELETRLRESVAYFDLVSDVRVHDFHVRAVPPHDPARKKYMAQSDLRSPIAATPRQGGKAEVMVGKAGLESRTTRNSSVDFGRPLQQQNDSFWDRKSAQWVKLAKIVPEYLTTFMAAIEE